MHRVRPFCALCVCSSICLSLSISSSFSRSIRSFSFSACSRFFFSFSSCALLRQWRKHPASELHPGKIYSKMLEPTSYFEKVIKSASSCIHWYASVLLLVKSTFVHLPNSPPWAALRQCATLTPAGTITRPPNQAFVKKSLKGINN